MGGALRKRRRFGGQAVTQLDQPLPDPVADGEVIPIEADPADVSRDPTIVRMPIARDRQRDVGLHLDPFLSVVDWAKWSFGAGRDRHVHHLLSGLVLM